MTYRELWQTLIPTYDEREAKSIARLVFEQRFGLSMTDICIGKDKQLSDKTNNETKKIAERLLQNEPVQYVLGCETFCGRTFKVRPGVLIPRPETAGLITLMKQLRDPQKPSADILDIGTGSGCIAVTAALDIPGADVTAWDISGEALATATENAGRLGAQVRMARRDALRPPEDNGLWDFVVSNPPYICEKERAEMSRNVLDHEPATALFVPDNDPLMFYRAIARYSRNALRRGGWLLFEINPLYAGEMLTLLAEGRFDNINISDDMFGRKRFAVAQRPCDSDAAACYDRKNDTHYD